MSDDYGKRDDLGYFYALCSFLRGLHGDILRLNRRSTHCPNSPEELRSMTLRLSFKLTANLSDRSACLSEASSGGGAASRQMGIE
jgi:hypothetical protein